MFVPPTISDDAIDELVTVFFQTLPSMDTNELVAFFNVVVEIMAREVKRALLKHRFMQSEN